MLVAALPGDASAVLALYDDAARWMLSRGIRQWRSGDRPLSFFSSAAASGDLLVWRSTSGAVGAVMASDPDHTAAGTRTFPAPSGTIALFEKELASRPGG